jgi:hypothetical protein
MLDARCCLAGLLLIAAFGCGSSAPGAGAMSGNSGAAGAGEDLFGNSTGNPVAHAGGMAGATGNHSTATDGECGATTLQPGEVTTEQEIEVESEVVETLPAALYIMLDRSRSMSNNGLWEPAIAAISEFVNDPASAGFDVALQYFPVSGGVCSSGSGYSTPAVTVGRLPEHAVMIDASLDAADANGGGGTPIEGALRGVTEFCKQFQSEHPEEPCVAVLVTDGLPQNASGCTESHSALAAIAGDAFMAGVTTFAVGLDGADFSLLDRIAMEGGAPDCDAGPGYACDISAGASQLAAVLATIRDTVTRTERRTEITTVTEEHVLECEWTLPEPPAGQQFDRDKVNVQISATGMDRALGRVGDPDACAAGGWHYDDPAFPSRIIVCPETCDALRATPNARIDVLLGCATELLVE